MSFLYNIILQLLVTIFFVFEQLLAARAGLQVRAQDRNVVEKTLRERAQSHQMNAAQYLDFLRSDASSGEWNALFVELTNGESYFFRDAGQFALLREQILPELIARNAASRTLKLWSAGCSSGEEAYSLAICLDALLPFQSNWNVEILATDLSENALKKARAAIYGAWAFRNAPDDLRDRYFQKRDGNWVLDERLRRRVTFRQSNLRDETLPAAGEFDLILCRNVFIYFRREAVAQVARKLCDALRVGGYLLTGHAELHDLVLPDLETRNFAPSVVFQRTSSTRFASQTRGASPTEAVSNDIVPISPKAPVATTSRNEKTEDALETVRRARDLWRAGQLQNALILLQPFVQSPSRDASARNVAAQFGALCLLAQHAANNARHDEALAFCARASALDALSPLPYHVQARVEEERGHHERAREMLKKALYLAPRSVVAATELSALYAREGDTSRAKNWRDAALKILNEHSIGENVAVSEWSLDATQSAEQLRAQLQADLCKPTCEV